jgi:hypothetical protein
MIGRIAIAFLLVCLTGFKAHPYQDENIEFSCLRMHKATNTCHFNFIIDGARYRYLDIGCKYNKKRDEVIKKAKAGTLALARDWKIECLEKVKSEK